MIWFILVHITMLICQLSYFLLILEIKMYFRYSIAYLVFIVLLESTELIPSYDVKESDNGSDMNEYRNEAYEVKSPPLDSSTRGSVEKFKSHYQEVFNRVFLNKHYCFGKSPGNINASDLITRYLHFYIVSRNNPLWDVNNIRHNY